MKEKLTQLRWYLHSIKHRRATHILRTSDGEVVLKVRLCECGMREQIIP